MRRLLDRIEQLRYTAETLQEFSTEEDAAAVQHAFDVALRAEARLGLSPEHTVVALAGATGSGKSSMLNAIAGSEVTATSVRRPTTSQPLACVWGDGAGDLLAALKIGQIQRLEPGTLAGLVVIDLPDIDSVSTAHREIARTLYAHADVVLWVLDPQKYADASIHRDHLVPMASLHNSMVVALNKIDTLAKNDQQVVLGALADLLQSEGLGSVPVLGVSATSDEGIADLVDLLRDAVESKAAAEQRISADVTHAARGLIPLVGYEPATSADPAAQRRLIDAVSSAAGVDIVAKASADEYRYRARSTAGFPLMTWVAKLPMSPLKRLGMNGDLPPELNRLALPSRSASADAVLKRGVRSYSTAVTEQLPRGLRNALRDEISAVASMDDDLLEGALARTELPSPHRAWWRAASIAHWLFITATVVGLGFLAAKTWLDWFATSAFGDEIVGPLPWAGVCVLGGVFGSLVVSACVNAAIGVGAARQRRIARARLRSEVAALLDETVFDPTAQIFLTHEEAQRSVANLAELPS